MSPDWIIGALALITIGGVLVLSVVHFGSLLRDPKNVDAVKSVAADRESAATKVSSESVDNRSLRQRLDEAPGLNTELSVRSSHSRSFRAILFDTKWSEIRAVVDQGRDRRPS